MYICKLNPHLTFAVEAGDKSEILLDNVEINRSKATPLVDPSSFSNELNGYTAAADNPLKLHFSFLNVQGTRSAGISNLVIEGTLVGAAAQWNSSYMNKSGEEDIGSFPSSVAID